MRRLVLSAALFTTSCLIPWRKSYVMRPQGTVRVVGAKGVPLVAAQVELERIRRPHSVHEARFSEKTDAAGEARFHRELATLTVFPLMMHGVPEFAFSVCVEAPGYAAKTVPWQPNQDGVAENLSIVLRGGHRPCRMAPLTGKPKEHEPLVSAVEELESGELKLELLAHRDQALGVGKRFVSAAGISAEIVSVENSGTPVDDVRYTFLVVTGARVLELRRGERLKEAP